MKYTRNQVKFEQHRNNFELMTSEANMILDKTEFKLDRVLIDLTLKFSKQMQLNFFIDMNKTFNKLQNIQGEMIATHQNEEAHKRKASTYNSY